MASAAEAPPSGNVEASLDKLMADALAKAKKEEAVAKAREVKEAAARAKKEEAASKREAREKDKAEAKAKEARKAVAKEEAQRKAREEKEATAIKKEEEAAESNKEKKPGFFPRLFGKKEHAEDVEKTDVAEEKKTEPSPDSPEAETTAGEKPAGKKRGFPWFGQKKDQPEPAIAEEEEVEYEESDPAKRSFWQKLTSKTPEPGTKKKKKKKFRWPWSQEKVQPEDEGVETGKRSRKTSPVINPEPLPMPEIKAREPETGLAPANPNQAPAGKKPDPIDDIDLYPGGN